ncbi:MAG: ABC transporter permease [Clostridia bacterium]|nr:ABC transporter permease [Clostridia bacterium]
MFMHIFNYRVKCLVRDKETVFWTLLFPLLLGTMFYFAFGHVMGAQETFNPVRTVVVDSPAYRENARFRQVLESLSKAGADQILELTVVDEKQAYDLLEDGSVVGVITVGGSDESGESIGLTVKQSGINQSILKAVLDEYSHTSKTVTSIVAKNPGAVQQVLAGLGSRRSYTEQVSYSDTVSDPLTSYFYALVAMACMYSGFWGLRNTIDVQADLSAQGARRSVAPTHKLNVVLCDAAAAVTVSFAEVLVLLAYLVFALRVSFGNQLGFILLTCFAGCVAGVSFGHFVGTVVRKSEGVKTGILIGANMAMSFLAGLMTVEMKDTIARKAPVLSYINPATLINDAFYSLYVFDNHRRFFVNIGMLCLISALMCAVSFIQLRRDRYASI